jgi:cobalamin-dependent methionine synthase I
MRWAHLVKSLKDPEMICGFVVTSGQALEDAISRRQEESLFHAYLLDAVGSVVTERLTDQLDQHVSGLLGARGYETTARFSPGYCDWELQGGQKAMFRFLQPESVGVNITSAGMMIPQKSISAVLVGAREVSLRSPCSFCAKGDCPYRREELSDPEAGH